MADLNSALASANEEANAVFGKLAKAVEQAAKRGGTINVAEVARQAGLELDEKVLAGLHIDPVIHILPRTCRSSNSGLLPLRGETAPKRPGPEHLRRERCRPHR